MNNTKNKAGIIPERLGPDNGFEFEIDEARIAAEAAARGDDDPGRAALRLFELARLDEPTDDQLHDALERVPGADFSSHAAELALVVVEELVANIVEHGYGYRVGEPIAVLTRPGAEDRFEVVLWDRSDLFDHVDNVPHRLAPRRRYDLEAEERIIGLVQMFDDVHVSSFGFQ